MIRRLMVLVALSSLTMASSVRAQSAGAIEMGFDGGVSFQFIDNEDVSLGQVSFPTPVLRVGYFLTDQLEIEPRGGLQAVKLERESDDPFSSLPEKESAESGFAALSLAYHPGDPNGSRMFFRGAGLVTFAGVGAPNSQAGAEAAVGYKARLASRWAARIELATTFMFDSDTAPGSWSPSLTVGISHFTR